MKRPGPCLSDRGGERWAKGWCGRAYQCLANGFGREGRAGTAFGGAGTGGGEGAGADAPDDVCGGRGPGLG